MTSKAVYQTRSIAWKWWVCGLLLFASMINYMDRQTLANVAVRICDEFTLSQEKYGNLEMVFGWSLTGFATGFVHTYAGLLICRTLLGLFESGHWPCGLKTTQRLLQPQD